MNVLHIVEKYLLDNEYDGLYDPEPENQCCCEIGDLAKCNCDYSDCEPGYKIDGSTYDTSCDYHIVPNKPEKK